MVEVFEMPEMPKSARNPLEKRYPFRTIKVGQGFFVPVLGETMRDGSPVTLEYLHTKVSVCASMIGGAGAFSSSRDRIKNGIWVRRNK